MSIRTLILTILLPGLVTAATQAKPTLFIIGDSTVRNNTAGQQGWGDSLGAHFDPTTITVVNRAIGGRSSRTFLTEGRWDAVLAQLKPGDFVLMQFGHNDGGSIDDDRCRASLKGIGDESRDIVRKTDGKAEIVHTYGWYLRRYIDDTKAKGGIPIVASPIPRNIWTDGKINRDTESYNLWARQSASSAAAFIPLHDLLADAFQKMGQKSTGDLFAGTDHTHTNASGANYNGRTVAEAIRSVEKCPLRNYLLPQQLWVPRIFGDHMVLQRDVPITVWGTATPGKEVQVTLSKSTERTTADQDGRWNIKLPAMKAGGPLRMEIKSPESALAYQDVQIGEVWLCSGQSNMDFTLAKTEKRSFSGVTDWQSEVAKANQPMIRMFSADWAMNGYPQRDVPGSWAVCSPTTAGDFSAVAYYFGKALQEKLGVPVGLVTCAFGASKIEAWIRPESMESEPDYSSLMKTFETKVIAFRDNPQIAADYAKAIARHPSGKQPKNPDPYQDQHNPTVLFNGMIAPIAPYPLRGVIWYQGESNLDTRQLYPKLQKTLIKDLRQLWNNDSLPYYFVQLAAYKDPTDKPAPGGQIAEMREAQAKSLALPHTGMAVTIDIGDAKDIHPRDKHDVGQRLASLALAETYGQEAVPCGPLYQSHSVANGTIRVRFSHIGGGLVARNGQALRNFAIAGANGDFHQAAARIDGDEVVISSPDVPNPISVRYAWADNPGPVNFYNREGLPTAPFRTDGPENDNQTTVKAGPPIHSSNP